MKPTYTVNLYGGMNGWIPWATYDSQKEAMKVARELAKEHGIDDVQVFKSAFFWGGKKMRY